MKLTLENKDLRRAINKKTYNDSDVSEIINNIIEANLYIPVLVLNNTGIEMNEDGISDISIDTKAKLPSLKFEKLGDMLPVFTNGEEFVAYRNGAESRESYQPFVISFRTLGAFIEDRPEYNGFVLDPCGKKLPFTKEILHTIKMTLE